MATLLDGQEYGLASSELLGSSKTVVHFKITDSCLKTLEELAKVRCFAIYLTRMFNFVTIWQQLVRSATSTNSFPPSNYRLENLTCFFKAKK